MRQIDFGFEEPFDRSLEDPCDSPVEHSLYIDDLAGCISFLVNFTNLRALKFSTPPLTLLHARSMAYLESVVSILRDVRLPKLEELLVDFPVTHGFGLLCTDQSSSLQSPVEHVLRRLRYFELGVCISTDPEDRWRRGPSPVPE